MKSEQYIKMRENSLRSRRHFSDCVSHLSPTPDAIANCLSFARAYNDALNKQIKYLKALEPSEDVARELERVLDQKLRLTKKMRSLQNPSNGH